MYYEMLKVAKNERFQTVQRAAWLSLSREKGSCNKSNYLRADSSYEWRGKETTRKYLKYRQKNCSFYQDIYKYNGQGRLDSSPPPGLLEV